MNLYFKQLTDKGLDLLCSAFIRQIKEVGIFLKAKDAWPTKQSLKRFMIERYINNDVVGHAASVYWDNFQKLTGTNITASIMMIKMMSDEKFYEACNNNTVGVYPKDEFDKAVTNAINHELGFLAGLDVYQVKITIKDGEAEFLRKACEMYSPPPTTKVMLINLLTAVEKSE